MLFDVIFYMIIRFLLEYDILKFSHINLFSRHSLVYIGLNQNGKSAHNNQPKKFTFYWGEGYNYLKVCN